MTENKPVLIGVTLEYSNAPSIYISMAEIKRMTEAAEALEMIHTAKNIAERLSKL